MDTASAASKLGSAALPNNNGGVSINIDGPEGSINNDGSSDDRKLTSSHKRQLSITLASPLPTSLSPIQQLLSSSPPTENSTHAPPPQITFEFFIYSFLSNSKNLTDLRSG
jgi:hypothetical protein